MGLFFQPAQAQLYGDPRRMSEWPVAYMWPSWWTIDGDTPLDVVVLGDTLVDDTGDVADDFAA